MGCSRFLIICCLLVTVPMQGMALVVQIQPPCPMESMMMAGMGDAHGAMTVMPKGDCCLDDEAAALSGQLCKTGQECHAGQLSIMNTATAATFHGVSPAPAYLSGPAYIPFALTAIWRPPLSLLH